MIITAVLEGMCALIFAQSSEIRTEISIDGAPWLGDPKAKVTLVEFSDYECPLSGQYFNWTMRQIVDDYVKTGKVKYVIRDFPLESIHPLAEKAAEAAHCAGEQGKYWAMHDRLLNNQASLQPEILPLHADVLRLNGPKFRQCLGSNRYTNAVRESAALAKTAGSQGTPAFFLGLTDPDGSKLQAVTYIAGAQPYAIFKETIEELLSSSKK